MAILIDAPSFTANEVYEIQATDPVEGSATGASFGGLGLSNQPHQQLANRTSYLKQRQDTNIGNIVALQAFTGFFKGLMGANGYLEIPFIDVNRGLITAIVQWGKNVGALVADGDFTVSWPIAFPNQCMWVLASLSNAGDNHGAGVVVMETVSFAAASGVFKSDWSGIGTAGQAALNDGFYWLAFGF
ncbi:MAG TPA: hypothetical protein VN867_06915 [Candidatus Binataceae bacterium]|nr:hypothetical protein [Candidatus Binataceae bacterium]